MDDHLVKQNMIKKQKEIGNLTSKLIDIMQEYEWLNEEIVGEPSWEKLVKRMLKLGEKYA